MLIVIIKAAGPGQSDWITVAGGTWVPGDAPKRSRATLPAPLIEDLFAIPVGPDETRFLRTACR